MSSVSFFFFFNDTATTEIYTLSLHDALPISGSCGAARPSHGDRRSGCSPDRWSPWCELPSHRRAPRGDRKSTRLNSSHANISYAVFCLKKKKRHDAPPEEPYVKRPRLLDQYQ